MKSMRWRANEFATTGIAQEEDMRKMIVLRPWGLAAAATLVATAALASPELARSNNCVACHHLERKMIGPPFKAIAARYAGDDNAVKVLSEKVVKGGGGNWGPTAMPAQAGVSQENAEILVKWILSQQ
jgi:cytochrome c